jgi:hypothetical protein
MIPGIGGPCCLSKRILALMRIVTTSAGEFAQILSHFYPIKYCKRTRAKLFVLGRTIEGRLVDAFEAIEDRAQ